MKIERISSQSNGTIRIEASEVDEVAKHKLARAFFTEEHIFPFFADDICDEDESVIDIVGIWQSGDRTALKLSNGETYRARPEAGDKYDPEKGVMMCLLKACGISSSDFLEVMKNVERIERPKAKDALIKKSAFKNRRKNA